MRRRDDDVCGPERIRFYGLHWIRVIVNAVIKFRTLQDAKYFLLSASGNVGFWKTLFHGIRDLKHEFSGYYWALIFGFSIKYCLDRARGSLVDCDTMLHARKSWVRFLI
jgi:hypothetical protein